MIFVLFIFLLIVNNCYSKYNIKYYNQKLDHLNKNNKNTFQQRYLISNEFWNNNNNCKGPIFLYTGNEGSITAFWEASGFITDVLAPKFNALLVFPEERYYGESLPFGSHSFEPENVKYLTTEQVLNDYVEIINYLKEKMDAQDVPVFAFGGSYGGTLSTLIRLNFPNVIAGALAASAPVGYYDYENWKENNVTTFTWNDIVVRDYAEARQGCLGVLQSTIKKIESTPNNELLKIFNVCSPQGLGKTKSSLFVYALESLPQLNYPKQLEIFLNGQ